MGRNKTRLFAGVAMSSLLVLGACGEDETVTEHVGDETPTPAESPEEADPSGGVDEAGGVTFGFTDLEVEAVYPEGEVVYASYEEIRDQVEAEYTNDLEGITAEGDDAWDEMEQAISSLEIDPDTPEEEVISAVVSAFELEDGFETLQIDVTYEDGTSEEYQVAE